MRMYRFINSIAQAEVMAPAALAGTHLGGRAAFGPQSFELTGEVVPAVPDNGCTALSNAAVNGKIALISRGVCSFDVKVLNAQNAGAIGVVVVNSADGTPPAMGAGSVAGSVTIPAIQVARAQGDAWRASPDPVTLRMSATTTERSSALDNTVIAHEWGHFISNRLIGNGSGLGTNHSRGLGEGWGDFHALLMMVAPQDIVQPSNSNWTGAYGMAGYAMGIDAASDPANAALFGLRRYPYSTSLAKNPLTLRHVTAGVALPGAVPTNANGGNNAEVHNMGEVWASMLWEFYASLLRAHLFQEAQDRMKQYLVAGYKLTPVNPTLTEARDALLAAAGAMDLADQARGVAAFAKRGAGAFAHVPDRYSTTNAGVVESFVTDGALRVTSLQMAIGTGPGERCDADEALDLGETGWLTMEVSNQGYQMVSGAQVTLSADVAALVFPDGAVPVPNVAAGASVTVRARVQLGSAVLPTGARITADLVQTGAPSGFVASKQTDILLHRDQIANRLRTDNAEAVPSAMEYGSSLVSAANTWHVRAQDILPHARYYAAQGAGAAGSHWMRTPALQVAATGDFTLAFSHRYNFEADGATYYDGGQLMISVEGGAWTRVDSGAAYGGLLFVGANNPAEGQRAYVGDSGGWRSANINLGTAYAGKAVRLAWVVQEDMAVVSEGWQVDGIAITGITNTPFPEVVADAQLCTAATLNLVSGSPQSAPTGTAFGQPLRVRLLQSPGGTPLAGLAVAFSAPVSGATAVLTATVLTDADGYALVTPTASSEAGHYVVAATASGQTVQFDLRNTGASAGTGSGAGGPTPLTISGAAPGGLGTVTATVTLADKALPAQAYFSQKTFATPSGAGVPTMPGHDFPFGLMGFALENVGLGNAITLHIQYPAPVPAGAEYWKYGRTMPGGAEHWHQIPMTLVGGAGTDTIEIKLTDGGVGDTDAKLDGTITDPGGLRVLAAAPGPGGTVAAIPTLEPWALAAMALLLGGLARRRLRRLAGI
jgi:hypothetical protein